VHAGVTAAALCARGKRFVFLETCSHVQKLLLDAGRVPQFLRAWLSWQATWQTFSFDFLKAWGGRWAPALDRGGDDGGGAWWLWVTSIYVHQNLNHIISNLLLFIAMSVHLELNYGWWRLLLVWIISGAPPVAIMHACLHHLRRSPCSHHARLPASPQVHPCMPEASRLRLWPLHAAGL
jgi:Rhomboid family